MRALCARLIKDARADIQTGRTKLATKQGRGPRGLPAGAFVHHLLQADSTLLGRPFTDDEARSCMGRSTGLKSALCFTRGLCIWFIPIMMERQTLLEIWTSSCQLFPAECIRLWYFLNFQH